MSEIKQVVVDCNFSEFKVNESAQNRAVSITDGTITTDKGSHHGTCLINNANGTNGEKGGCVSGYPWYASSAAIALQLRLGAHPSSLRVARVAILYVIHVDDIDVSAISANCD